MVFSGGFEGIYGCDGGANFMAFGSKSYEMGENGMKRATCHF